MTARRDAARLAETSRRLHADRIRAPLFLAHYAENRTIRADQSKAMAAALEGSGKPHHLLVLDDERQTGPREALKLRYHRNLEAFFYRSLGTGAHPGVSRPAP